MQAGVNRSCSVGIEENCLRDCMTINERSIAWIICCINCGGIANEGEECCNEKNVVRSDAVALVLSCGMAEGDTSMNRIINVTVNSEEDKR